MNIAPILLLAGALLSLTACGGTVSPEGGPSTQTLDTTPASAGCNEQVSMLGFSDISTLVPADFDQALATCASLQEFLDAAAANADIFVGRDAREIAMAQCADSSSAEVKASAICLELVAG